MWPSLIPPMRFATRRNYHLPLVFFFPFYFNVPLAFYVSPLPLQVRFSAGLALISILPFAASLSPSGAQLPSLRHPRIPRIPGRPVSKAYHFRDAVVVYIRFLSLFLSLSSCSALSSSSFVCIVFCSSASSTLACPSPLLPIPQSLIRGALFPAVLPVHFKPWSNRHC